MHHGMFVISPCFTLQAYLYSSASRILGVELDRSFCDLQERIVQKYNMADRVEVGAHTHTHRIYHLIMIILCRVIGLALGV